MNDYLYPYLTLEAPFTLALECRTKGAVARDEQRVITLADAAVEAVAFQARVAIDKSALAELSEEYDDLSVVCVLAGQRTELRQGTMLSRSGADEGIWSSKLEVDRRNCHGDIIAKAVMSGRQKDGRLRRLGESVTWTLRFDGVTVPQFNSGIIVTWKNFGGDDPRLREIVDEPFYLDLDGPVPTVYLNSRIEGMAEILPNAGSPPGQLRPMYELLRTSIARSAWQALINVSVAAIVDCGEDGDNEFTLPTVEWQGSVLKKVLPIAFPDLDFGDALRVAGRSRDSEADMRQFASRILAALERDIVRDGVAVRRALRSISPAQQEQ